MLTTGCDIAGINVTTSNKAPLINSFVADPPTIAAGASSTLNWSVTGATTVSIDQGIGNVSLAGNRAVMPNATTVYTLTATNAAGVSISATAQVIVTGATAPTPTPGGLPMVNYFTANPSNIYAGSSTTLSWNVSNATAVSISGVGTVGLSGSTTVSPAASTDYTLTATNSTGSKMATTQVIVTGTSYPYPPTSLPAINYFTANPSIISAGNSTTLSWNVSNATSVTIEPGVGSVSSVGTTLVSPASSMNYTLTATNAAGYYYMTITVLVMGGLPPVATGWTGNWSTNWGEMSLSQIGNQVTGNYNYDSGQIIGTVSGNVLTGTWAESPTFSPPDDAGDIEWTLSLDGNSFTGQWRYGSSGDWDGSWTGTRIP